MKRWNEAWSPEEEARVIRMWGQGFTLTRIADELQRSPGAVRKAVARMRARGINLQKFRRRSAYKRIDDRVAPLRAAGLSPTDVAYRLCIAVSSARRAFGRLKKIGPVARKSRVDVANLIELWQSGLTTTKVAEVSGKPHGTVCRIIWMERKRGTLDANGNPIRSNRMTSEFLSEAATNNRRRKEFGHGRSAE